MNPGVRLFLCVLVVRIVTGVAAGGGEAPVTALPTAAADHAVPMSVLDSQLACFDALIAKIPDVQQRTAAKALSDGFKDRRVDMQKSFNHDLFLDLRWEIDVEYQRLIAWFAAPTVTVPVSAAEHAVVHAIELLRPDPFSKAETQMALDVLDRQIQSIDEPVGSLPSDQRRAGERTQVAQIKERRVQLGKDFTKQRWDDLTDAIIKLVSSKAVSDK